MEVEVWVSSLGRLEDMVLELGDFEKFRFFQYNVITIDVIFFEEVENGLDRPVTGDTWLLFKNKGRVGMRMYRTMFSRPLVIVTLELVYKWFMFVGLMVLNFTQILYT